MNDCSLDLNMGGFMSRRTDPNDMINHILSATELLVAKEGLQNLSMRKIAKEIGVAAGTLYLYFSTKDQLLSQLANHIYERYSCYINIDFDPNESLFKQYRQMWVRKWQFLSDNPMIAIHLSQYQAMLGFSEIVYRTINDPEFIWNRFVDEGKKQGVIVDLPNEVLYYLSMGTATDIAYLQQVKKDVVPEEYFEEIISRTWKAITF
ncbi:TetR/AcrR family transcriptional regulator [Actinobacillus suis]